MANERISEMESVVCLIVYVSWECVIQSKMIQKLQHENEKIVTIYEQEGVEPINF